MANFIMNNDVEEPRGIKALLGGALKTTPGALDALLGERKQKQQKAQDKATLKAMGYEGVSEINDPQLQQMLLGHEVKRNSEKDKQSSLQQQYAIAKEIYDNPDLSSEEKLFAIQQALPDDPQFAKALNSQLETKELMNQFGLSNKTSSKDSNAPISNKLPLGIGKPNNGNSPSEMPQDQSNPNQLNLDEYEFPEELIIQAGIKNPNLAKSLSAHNDRLQKERIEKDKQNFKNAVQKRKEFEKDRDYNTKFSQKSREEAEGLRSSLPKKENALKYAREAIQSSNLKFFSPDKLADITGLDVFRTAKGAQLIAAGKENLLSNMNNVSAKAQNIWFEQRLNSIFPKIGQSTEANLTMQEMLEGELALDRAYLKAYDEIAKEDDKEFGYEKKDISERAHNKIAPLETQIFNRSVYRMKELEEQEKGLKSLQGKVGEKVQKGTYLTLANAKLYRDKYGKDALTQAQKDGYIVPSIEEYKIYQENPDDFIAGIAR